MESKLLGGICAVSAFGLWAILPIYFNLIGPAVSSWELLLHRVVWAAVLLLTFTLVAGRGARVTALLSRPGRFMALTVSALAIAGNWGTFLWAVTHGEILQSSLGYYINPLLSVFLGFCFLRERLTVLQTLAVAIAAVGVGSRVVGFGEVPWLALMMAGFFGLYGLIRKQVDVDGVTGLLMETLILLPVAIIWLAMLWADDSMAFGHVGPGVDALLVGAGLVTVVPLVLFAVAARRLKLATIGLTQYIAPTGHLLIGVFLYGEPFTRAEAVTFGCIWLGLALYTADIWLQPRREAAASASS
ncbi:EamA family transporter RarD [Ectothiorhodospiraceae bacterium WFHF3C12]|nr:EamA family transporter RarD [Ectothiorhodospiraceae bacterium WFHF3C12]